MIPLLYRSLSAYQTILLRGGHHGGSYRRSHHYHPHSGGYSGRYRPQGQGEHFSRFTHGVSHFFGSIGHVFLSLWLYHRFAALGTFLLLPLLLILGVVLLCRFLAKKPANNRPYRESFRGSSSSYPGSFPG